MRAASSIAVSLAITAMHVAAAPSQQTVLSAANVHGEGKLSAWSLATKRAFLQALEDDTAQNWTVVMGNEGSHRSPC